MQNIEELWQKTLQEIEKKISKPSFDTWLKSTRALSFEGNTIIVEAPNDFARDWLDGNYKELLTDIIDQLIGERVNIKFVIPQAKNEEFAIRRNHVQIKQNNRQTSEATSHRNMLNPKYTFETFVIGSGNRFAHAASLAVAEAPAKAYNPLFIYGGVGLGKTHLMHAIGHYVLEHNPTANVVYVTC